MIAVVSYFSEPDVPYFYCEVDPVARCVSFHSDWMARAPDAMLAEEASTRRERFPVAAVFVVHDDISLMRTTLEEIATVVEHIVSGTMVLCCSRGEGYLVFLGFSGFSGSSRVLSY